MEERYSLVDHKASFKTKGMGEFSDKVQNFIDKSINRNASELEALKQIVTKYKGKKVQLVTVPLSSGSFNSSTVTIIDWNEEKSKGLPMHQRFLKSPFPSDYVPFAYSKNDEGKESLYLCELLDTPSPWIRCYNDESSNSWAGHYFGNSIRNCAIIPYTMPEKYIGKNAQTIVNELEALAKEGDSEKIKAAEFDNMDHLNYVIEIAKGNIQEGFAEAQAFLNEVNEKMKKEMDNNIEAAKSGGLLDPINGVSMEDWAAANAKIAGGMPFEDVLKILGVEKPIWDSVSAEWMSRMSLDTTFAISTVYGSAFTNSNIGKFAGAGGNSAVGNDNIEKVKNDFELYIKIMCHQNISSMQGIDAASILKQYGLTAADWGMVGGHWAPKMATDLEMTMKMSTLMDKYNTEFMANAPAQAGDDIDF